MLITIAVILSVCISALVTYGLVNLIGKGKDFTTTITYGVFGDLLNEVPKWKDEEIITGKKHEAVWIAISTINKKLDLILKELGKEYVPEKDTTEPAKLVTRLDSLGTLSSGGVVKMPEDWNIISGPFISDATPTGTAKDYTTKPKKKRKTTKKKK